MKHLPIHTPQFEGLYAEFFSAIQTKGYRGKSSMYPSCAREFLFFTENRGITDIGKVKAGDIIAYYEYLRERPNQRREGGLSDSMIRHHLFSLRLFFDHLLDMGHIESSPARLPKFQIGRCKERNIVTTDEVQEIYKACESLRDRALISIAYGCGLRRSEIENLDTGDVLLHKGMLVVRCGKNKKSRMIPLSDSVLADLKNYIIHERPKYFQKQKETSRAFFLNTVGRRMQGDKHNNRLKELIGRTGNAGLIGKEITLHCLRHSIATHLLDNGATMEFVQRFLGHAGIDTAHIYSRKRKQRMAIMDMAEKGLAHEKRSYL